MLKVFFRAGEGNRTPVYSLEGCHSTIELHPHFFMCSTKRYYTMKNSIVKGFGKIIF